MLYTERSNSREWKRICKRREEMKENNEKWYGNGMQEKGKRAERVINGNCSLTQRFKR